MASQEHLNILLQGTAVWNSWRADGCHQGPVDLTDAQLIGSNLGGADLRWVDLGRADLRQTNLIGADLSNAILSYANLGQADLSGANLTHANLWWANFWRAKAIGANLTEAELWHANFSNTNLSGALLTRADLTATVIVETDLRSADLSGATVYGISVWNASLEGALQSGLVITEPMHPRITVDDLEIAQFVYLLLNHQKLRCVLNAVAERGVLILGRFGGGGLTMLHALAARLRELKYLPIVFDFERPSNRDYTETIKTLVGLSRFVIADLSGPSVPQELYACVPHFDIPVVPILESGKRAYAMFADLFKYPWVLKPIVEFESNDHLQALLQERIIIPAEERHKARQLALEQLFGRVTKE